MIFIKTTFLFFISLVILSCARDVKQGGVILHQQSAQKEINQWEYDGDTESKKMHLMGWQRAASAYTEALKLDHANQQIQEKLFMALLMQGLREYDLTIFTGQALNKAESLAAGLQQKKLDYLLKVVRKIIIPFYDKTVKDQWSSLLPEFRSQAHSFYLYYRHMALTAAREKFQQVLKDFCQKYPNSNLTRYIEPPMNRMEQILEQYPEFIELLLAKGELLYVKRAYFKAKKTFDRILDIHTEIPSALAGLGRFYLGIGLYQEGKRHFQKMLSITPTDYRGLFGIAVCLYELDQYRESLQYLAQMIRDAPFYLGQTYYYKALNHLALEELDKTEDSIQMAKKFIPRSAELNILAGIFYYQQKNHDLSRSYIGKVLAVDPQHGDAHYYYGLLDIKGKKYTRALKHFHQAACCFEENFKKSQSAILKQVQKYPPALKQRLLQLKQTRLEHLKQELVQKLQIVLNAFHRSTSKEIIGVRAVIAKFTKDH